VVFKKSEQFIRLTLVVVRSYRKISVANSFWRKKFGLFFVIRVTLWVPIKVLKLNKLR